MGWWSRRKVVTRADERVVATIQGRPQYWSPYASTGTYLPGTTDPAIYKLLRQALPVLDASIDQLVRLTGNPDIVWDSERVQREWDEWQEVCRVAPLTRGFSNWLDGHRERTLIFGTAATEVVIDTPGRDIHGLQYIAPSTLRLRVDPANPMDVVVAQVQAGATEPVVLDRDFIVINAHKAEDDSPYGVSLFARIPFIAELCLEMVHALKQDWNRVGAPSFALIVKVPPGLDPSVDVSTLMGGLLGGMKEHWQAAMTRRQADGAIKDFFGAGDISIQTVGADGKRLDFEVPWRAALEQIVSVTHLPPWMLGFHWSTTERLSEEQAQALEDVIQDYQDDFSPTALFVADWWAKVRGYAAVGRELRWPSLSLRDRVEIARAEMITAQAAQTRQKTGRQLWADGVYNQQRYADYVVGEKTELAAVLPEPAEPVDRGPAPAGGPQLMARPAQRALPEPCGCGETYKRGEDAATSIGEGEEPHDQRIADAIDGFYKDAKTAVRELRRDTWQILDLPEVENRAATPSLTRADDPFSMTPAQERKLDTAIEKFLEKMAGEDRTRRGFADAAEANDGIIQQYDVYAHSVGVKRAVEMTEAEGGASVDLSRDGPAVQGLLEHAFDRLSDQGHMRLDDQLGEIKEIIADGVEFGENPLSIARSLSDRFDSYETREFSRLARTEVAFAQVEGQMNEFRAEGVDVTAVENDPPPWHPNCMCDCTIERDENGNWRAVYEIAATACDLCQAYTSQA